MSTLTRRRFLETAALASAEALLASRAFPMGAAGQPGGRPNVLFLMSDDTRPWLGCFGHPEMQTPNLDRLAGRSVRFDGAYCQYPICNPSRTSMLTGRYPNKTRIIENGNHHFRDVHPDWVTLPQFFKQNGYATANSGKVFHSGAQDPDSWTEWVKEYVPEQFRHFDDALFDNRTVNGNPHHLPHYRVLEGDGESSLDYWIAESGIALLRKYKDRPFFIAVGLHGPHAAPTAARRFLDPYPLDRMPLPPDFATRPTPPGGCPRWVLPANNDAFYMSDETTPAVAREVISAYRAAVSNADWNLGRVLDEVDRLGLAENTIIVVASDHGYHNGEKGRWGKNTVFEVAHRVTLMVHVPGGAGNGRVCRGTVQLLDLYPTLCALCGLPRAPGLQGSDISPLLAAPDLAWDVPACAMARVQGPIGYTVRAGNYRYAEWNGGRDGSVLFDHANDPDETRNLAQMPAHRDIVVDLQGKLKLAFEDDMPARMAPVEAAYALKHNLIEPAIVGGF